MSLLKEIKSTVVQCQQAETPTVLYPSLQVATATYNYADLNGLPGTFQLSLDSVIPKGAIFYSWVINILATPVGPTQILFDLGTPDYYNYATNIPGDPWNLGLVPAFFGTDVKVTMETSSVGVTIDNPDTAGVFTMSFYYV